MDSEKEKQGQKSGKMEEVYFDIPFELTNPFEKKIAEVFLQFDRNNVNMIDGSDVGAVLRSLGCVPTEDDIKKIISQAEFPNHPGNIHLTKFISCLKSFLAEQKMKPSLPEDLLKAFKLLDPEDKGFIHAETFKELFIEIGEPMTKDELNEMMKSAVDRNDNRVYYEAYINTLVHEPKECIYELAAKFATFDKDNKKLKS